MFRKDFIYTLFCGDIPEGQRVYRANGAVADDNIENLGLQNEYQPHPKFDLYEANDKGVVRRRKTKKVIENLHNTGYLHINVRGTKTDFVGYYSHRFVYETFHGAISAGLVIDHINKIKTDNCLENLDLVTSEENTRRGVGSDGSNFKNPTKQIISINLKTSEKMKFKSIYSAAKYHKINSRAIKYAADNVIKSAKSMLTFDRFSFKYDN